MNEFCHLHVHTVYSLLDGAARTDELCAAASSMGMTHLAITDHGAMYGVVEFYRAAKRHGITPILGCEVYVAKNLHDKEARADREYSHLILLAETNEGYKNLIKLVSIAALEGFYYKPRIDYETLQTYHRGLIATSACLAGDIPRLILSGQIEQAQELAIRLQNIMGEGNFYLELQDHGIPEQQTVNRALIEISQKTGIPMIAANDVHYTRQEDAFAQDVLMCIQTGKLLSDTMRMKMQGDQFYLKSPQEMELLFSHVPQALENTQKIAQRCHVELDFHTQYLPQFPVPEGHTPQEYLRSLAEKGLKERYGELPSKEAVERLNYELSVIDSMGYTDYFLIVWDYIRFARESGIAVGPGRGSGAGSIVAYTLHITDLDPLRYGLIFERFLNPERISMPDIDSDFTDERRQEVVDYVIQKYGHDHAAQIITFSTLAARAALKDVGRVMGLSFTETNDLVKHIPRQLGITISDALKSPEGVALRTLYEQNETIHRVIDTAMRLEGMPRQPGTHAAGVVISKVPITDVAPLTRSEQKGVVSVVTQFEKNTVEEIGLLKMDILGLRNLSVIENTLNLLKDAGMQPPDFEHMEMDDPKVYEMIAAGDTDGVFQLESAGMRQLLRDSKPTCFEDIIACISLYRPGPMEQIPAYLKGRKDPSSIQYLTEKLRPILEVTCGCMVYQEQVMQVVRDLAGFSWARSDSVRKAMSKKKMDVMQAERQVFLYGTEDGSVPGCVKNGVEESVGNQIYDLMIDFGKYAFNKSHAAAYAVVAYRTAYLKAHYPVPFMAAQMNSMLDRSDKISQYVAYCRKNGIEIYPPDVNRSSVRFAVENEGIRFGLSAVKNVGTRATELILQERAKGGPFATFTDFVERIPQEALNKRMAESMIRAGCFDGMGYRRSGLAAIYEQIMDTVAADRQRNITGQTTLFDAFMEEEQFHMEIQPPPLPEWKYAQKLAYEKEVTGIYISGHPMMEYAQKVEGLTYNTAIFAPPEDDEAADRQAELDGTYMTLGGILSNVRTKATRDGKRMAYATLEDMQGTVELLFFPKTFEQYRGMLLEDQAVLVHGRASIQEERDPAFIVAEIAALSGDQDHVERLMQMDRGKIGRMREIPRGEDLPLYSPQEHTAFPSQTTPSAYKLWIRIKRFDNEFLMLGILGMLQKHPGNVPVYAVSVQTGERIRLRVQTDASPALLAELTDALDEGNVKLVENHSA